MSKSASFEFLHGDKPWDALQAQLLAKISQLLAPNMINFNDYDVFFYIPRNQDFPCHVKRTSRLSVLRLKRCCCKHQLSTLLYNKPYPHCSQHITCQ
ncbi:hypothetical protein PAXRUDRAFT_149838 [Paxillus rubicundulus Ve08.2h10]|uniref:Uncharacterized protein n=1 Tax=Paxillus rubicundulus Ve08.2h10 TaxID=930991 RepID=A0A0D0DJJ9_9AGAM|nr:hypothetical protein PAXRUDRAFT_149838 [Paxillus rubicundulus Ve08.2h10]